MTFDQTAKRAKSQHRVLVEIDIGIDNDQWVNHGAGIWTVNSNNVYDWVDSSLLEEGFTAQGFTPIGSVKSDGVPLQLGTSVLDLADTARAYYYDGANAMLYVTMPNFDEPALHEVSIGQTYAYATSDWRPTGGPVQVEGRLKSTPTVGAYRDPLFFGRLTFTGSSITLDNADGEFDRWGLDVDIYGNEARVFVGFEDVDYSEYLRVFTGFLESLTVSEQSIAINAVDKRKQLTKPITYTCTALSALTAIQEILEQSYGYTYDSTFYDTTAWEAERDNVEAVTINMQEPDAVINVIESIAASVFGFFRVNADGLFTFKVIDTTDDIETLIEEFDVLNAHSITYDPTAVLSSIRVGYDRDWTTTGAAYSYYEDTSREASVFNVYKTYNQQEFLTLLPTATAAAAFGTRVLDYVDTVRGVETITVPLENYAVQLGDQVGVVIQRGDQPMIGQYKAEVIGVEYTLDQPLMRLTLRHGAELEGWRITEDAIYRLTESGAIRMLEA